MLQPLLTARDVMALFGFKSRTSLYAAIRRGDIPPPRKIGNRNRWRPGDIERAISKLPDEPLDRSAATEASVKARQH